MNALSVQRMVVLEPTKVDQRSNHCLFLLSRHGDAQKVYNATKRPRCNSESPVASLRQPSHLPGSLAWARGGATI